MHYIRIEANECNYKEKDRRLNEQFINSMNNDDMMTEIELTVVKKPVKSPMSKYYAGPE